TSRERLYEDGVFSTGAEECALYGHDLETGATSTEEEYRARDPCGGRARIKAAHWQPPYEEPDSQFPLWLTTGRVVHHWHTRPKTHHGWGSMTAIWSRWNRGAANCGFRRASGTSLPAARSFRSIMGTAPPTTLP